MMTRAAPRGVLPKVAVYGAAATAAVAGRGGLLRWGAASDETHADLPGDGLVARADLVATRAISVRCPAEQVWPWIAQLGQGRGGFYSYDRLENLAGCDIHSADRIVPSWQEVRVGDEVRLFPEGGLVVAVADAERALVLQGSVEAGAESMPFEFSWAFVLRERTDGTTRLVVRERYCCTSWWMRLVLEPLAVVSFVMTQKMLRGIRDRAESATASSG